MKFSNYKHFINYCFKIATNKNIFMTDNQKNIFYEFEKVYNLLEELNEKGIVNLENSILDIICTYCKENKCDDIISVMDYFLRKVDKFYRSDVNFYYILTSLNSMLGLGIEFREEFITKENIRSEFFPSRIRVLKIEEGEEKVFSISSYDNRYKEKFGVYFIYDSNENLAYIGKSTTCVMTRSFQSAEERKLLDFSKIELRETNTKSDVAIYESYYIGKYKPRLNMDLIFEDRVSIKLPELEVSKEILRDVNKEYYVEKYIYFREKVIDIVEFFKVDKEKVFLYNEKNKEYLMEKGIEQKYTMRQKAYKKCIDRIKKKGEFSTTELRN